MRLVSPGEDPAVHAMARKLAAQRGTSVTDAVRQALIAILRVEPEATALLSGLSQPGEKLISTATLLETRTVLERQLGELREHALNLLLSKAQIRLMELDLLHVEWALKGWRRYGRENHPAGLNLGDCFSYGLAMALSAPLLFKGDDFRATDVMPAI